MTVLVDRIDPAPLIELARCNARPAPGDPAKTVTPHVTVRQIANRLGVSKRQVHRWLAGEFLRPRTADRLAVALGHHPAEIFPDWTNLKEQAA